MTIVAIWYESADGVLWSVADTRISELAENQSIIRSENAAKLLTLPISCTQMFNETGFKLPHYSTTYGFAYAGAVTPALLTYCNSATLLQTLQCVSDKTPPSLKSIAEFVRSVMAAISKQYLNSTNGKFGELDLAIFGWCPCDQEYQIFRLQNQLENSSFGVNLEKLAAPLGTEPFLLGSAKAKERFQHKLNEIAQGGDSFGRRTRLPKIAIEALIRENLLPGVGGDVSIARVDRIGFTPMSRSAPVVLGQPAAKLTFNGIEMGTEAAVVDNYIVAPQGLA